MIRAGCDDLDAHVDTLIVGSGPAGLTLAMELARLGKPSLVLESGVDGTSGAQALSDADLVDARRHDDMGIALARRLGGTSNLWAGRCVPLDPIDFEPRPYAGFTKWPIAYADIAPHYATACRYLACGAPIFDAPPVPSLRDDGFSASTLERASNLPSFAKAYRRVLRRSALIDLRLDATVVDIRLAETGRATHIVVANRDGQRRSIAARRVVLAAGGLETTRLLLALQREHTKLFGGAEGPLGRFYMGHLIGEVADIVFTTEKLDAAFDFFRDGHGSFVRRRLVPGPAYRAKDELPNICFWPVVPPIADAAHRSGALSAVALTLSVPGLGSRILPQAILKRHLQGALDWRAHAVNVASDLPKTAAFLAAFIKNRYLSKDRVHGYFVRNRARRYGLSYSSEQSPRPDSRVTLASTKDRLGLPRISIDLRFHRDDAEAVFRAHQAMGDWLSRSGAGHLIYRAPAESITDRIHALAAHGTHQIGLARMGTTRRDGVVNADLASFDIPNLFVVSSAAFPTSGQANPTLSTVALAARLAQRLASVG